MRKNYLRIFIIIAFVLFLLVNLSLIYKNYVNGDSGFTGYFMPHSADTVRRWEFYRSMHEKLDGTLTAEKADFIINENKRLESIVSDGAFSREYQPDSYTGYLWGDYVMISKYFYDPMKYIATYSINSDKIVEKAKDNIAFYEKYGNRYEKAKNEFIADHYSGRKITVFYDSKPWELLFDYNFSDLLILLLLLLGLVPMFVNEKETKMSNLILASKNGKINMTLIKVMSALTFVSFLVFAFSCENMLAFTYLYGLNGHAMPLYAIEKYQYSPLACSVLAFYFLMVLLKIIGFFSFGLFIFLLSSLLSRVIYTYMVSSLFLVGGIYASGYMVSVELGKKVLSFLSPVTLLKGNELYSKLLDTNILDNFLLVPYICILMQIITSSIIFLFICKTSAFKTLKKANVLPEKEISNGI